MRKLLHWALALFLVTFSTNVRGQAVSDAEIFGSLPMIADAAISQDGSKIALALDVDGRAIINVISAEDLQSVYSIALQDDVQLRAVGWAGDTLISFRTTSTLQRREAVPYNFRVSGPQMREYRRSGVLDFEARSAFFITATPRFPWADQGSLLISPIAGDPGFARLLGRPPKLSEGYLMVYRVDLLTGELQPIEEAGANRDTIGFVLNAKGDAVSRLDLDQETNNWWIVSHLGDDERVIMTGTADDGTTAQIAGLIDESHVGSLLFPQEERFSALYSVNLDTGESEKLAAFSDADISGVIKDPWSFEIVGIESSRGGTFAQYFVAELQEAHDLLAARFAEGGVRLLSWSEDKSRFLVFGETAQDGGAYYLYEPLNYTLYLIGLRYPRLQGLAPTTRKEITYPARDGARVPAILTMPEGDVARPLIVLVHGGPASHDTLDFDWWAGFLAVQGYAVLQPNFRGSTGYGRDWLLAGRREWGGLMQTDVEDGVIALENEGIVQPGRACIVGASYGGYAALAGATLTPDRYRCAASLAGVSDLEAMLRVEERDHGEESQTVDYWRASIGDRDEDRERIRSVSPARLADRVQIPILLIHGTDDTVVPITQSRLMYDRLRSAGKNVRFVQLRGDDHYLSDSETRIQALREIEAFLAEHLPVEGP